MIRECWRENFSGKHTHVNVNEKRYAPLHYTQYFRRVLRMTLAERVPRRSIMTLVSPRGTTRNNTKKSFLSSH